MGLTVGRAVAGRRVLVAGLLAVALGVAIGILIATTAHGGPFWSDGLLLGSYVLASSAIAALLGLVFAVPRARTENPDGSVARFVSNSNLEQISDWLTKILVGAGLVQLRALPAGLRALGDYLGGGLRMPRGATASVALAVYGAGVGFVFAYLWGRLRLRVLLEMSEKDAEDQARRQTLVASSLAAAFQRTGEPVSPSVIADTAAKATSAVTRSTAGQLLPVLWVDDHPENNIEERQALEALGIEVQTAISTDEALRRMETTRYGVVITDLGREEDGTEKTEAGVELIRAVRARYRGTPLVIYAGMRAFNRREELRGVGATEVFNRATDLVSFVVETLT
jgi:CheY-like chemotaxis protein